ncbi:MAG: Lrp/AsnC family transcriptional regulator [Geminicoccaceae bacterium]|nr:Lrp/AsnC family transcriptional regulator [Geminicoccaceae bacterium]MCB9944968.1 Lrp/AsnC family transcriptional regulator [Geminicoccaceae bacterium]
MVDLLDDVLRRKILIELQKDGRLTNQELAERVGASASPVWRRVKEMEEGGVIRRYAALLEPDAVGVGECVFAQVTIEKHNREMYTDFEEIVKKLPEVLECYALTGDADFLLKIHVKSVRDYDRLLNDHIFRIPGIQHVKSSFTLREIKYDTALPIDPPDAG